MTQGNYGQHTAETYAAAFDSALTFYQSTPTRVALVGAMAAYELGGCVMTTEQRAIEAAALAVIAERGATWELQRRRAAWCEREATAEVEMFERGME